MKTPHDRMNRTWSTDLPLLFVHDRVSSRTWVWRCDCGQTTRYEHADAFRLKPQHCGRDAHVVDRASMTPEVLYACPVCFDDGTRRSLAAMLRHLKSVHHYTAGERRIWQRTFTKELSS